MLTLLRRLFSVGTDTTPEENFFISTGLEFYGDLVARASSGRIEGKFDGHIIECRKLIIGPHATIKGNVFAEEIIVYGYCEGNLYAAGDMKVNDTAVILGDIHASSLIIEQNATFRGNLRKLRTEDFLEITAREKERIIQQRKSNVYNIHSLNARLEAEQRRSRRVANGLPQAQEPELEHRTPLMRLQSAAPIVVRSQERLVPQAVVAGSEMPRAINIRVSPVDVSTLATGQGEILMPAMDESFLPNYTVPSPLTGKESEIDHDRPAEYQAAENLSLKAPAEPSASMLLLEQELIEAEDPLTTATEEDNVLSTHFEVERLSVRQDFETVDAIQENLPEPQAPVMEHAAILQQDDSSDLSLDTDFFMEIQDAENLIEAQQVADERWMASMDAEDATDETSEAIESLPSLEEELALSETTFEDFMAESTEEELMEASDEEDESVGTLDSFIAFPSSINNSFEPFPIGPVDNGIRIDPSEPFIRIPDAAPREGLRIEDEQPVDVAVRATSEQSVDFDTEEAIDEESFPLVSFETLRQEASQSLVIPRQLSSPEAYELREASGTMIIFHADDRGHADTDPVFESTIRQEFFDSNGEPVQDSDELRLKLSAVPTAEPGYEPGYTNQQRVIRKPATAQPENTRRWF